MASLRVHGVSGALVVPAAVLSSLKPESRQRLTRQAAILTARALGWFGAKVRWRPMIAGLRWAYRALRSSHASSVDSLWGFRWRAIRPTSN